MVTINGRSDSVSVNGVGTPADAGVNRWEVFCSLLFRVGSVADKGLAVISLLVWWGMFLPRKQRKKGMDVQAGRNSLRELWRRLSFLSCGKNHG